MKRIVLCAIMLLGLATIVSAELLKDTADQKIAIYVWDGLNGVPATDIGANLEVKISKDGGAFAALTDTSATETGYGWYVYDLAQAETNCDMFQVAGYHTSDPNYVCAPIYVYPKSATQSGDITSIDGSTTAAAKLKQTFDTDWATAYDDTNKMFHANVSLADGEPLASVNDVAAKLGTTSGVYEDFDPASHSLQALRSRGDAAWITATGFSTHSPGDIWTVASREITGGVVDSATLANGAHGGENATLTLSHVRVQRTDGHAVEFISDSLSHAGLYADGGGYGILTYGGNIGLGVAGESAALSLNGIGSGVPAQYFEGGVFRTGLPSVMIDSDPNAITAQTMDPALIDIIGSGAVSGVGSVVVDHNYGGTDALAVKTAAGVGIDNAEIWAYLKTDYDAGRRSGSYIVARTRTNVYGRWATPMQLDPATYTLYIFKQGLYAPTTVEITVTED